MWPPKRNCCVRLLRLTFMWAHLNDLADEDIEIYKKKYAVRVGASEKKVNQRGRKYQATFSWPQMRKIISNKIKNSLALYFFLLGFRLRNFCLKWIKNPVRCEIALKNGSSALDRSPSRSLDVWRNFSFIPRPVRVHMALLGLAKSDAYSRGPRPLEVKLDFITERFRLSRSFLGAAAVGLVELSRAPTTTVPRKKQQTSQNPTLPWTKSSPFARSHKDINLP